jgi:hypothetical protein
MPASDTDPGRDTQRDDDTEAQNDRSGAFDYPPLLDESATPPPEEFQNPPGTTRGDCESKTGHYNDPDCELDVTSQLTDDVLEETKPGYGIEGFEAEEDGGS